jgi:aminoglycoside phosphotransferase (APT) family kinase protein
MDNIIELIIKNNISLFGSNPTIEKINVGFTNTLYKVNDSYIVKVCTNKDNENDFKREINFYNSNKNNSLIPKLYSYNTCKKEVPYYYEIIEKIDGVSLYNVWHTYSEEQREDIIKQLCDVMRQIHIIKGDKYDWSSYIKKEFKLVYDKVKKLNIFNDSEKMLIEESYNHFDKYLNSDEFVLVHNDLHFDNIIVNNGIIKIIDFERSMYAPKDFDLHILYYMIRQPWKHASEDCEKFTKVEDYSNIMSYIEKYYPEIIHIPYLYKRLAIYDVIYELSHFIQFPKHRDELSKAVFDAAKIVLGN